MSSSAAIHEESRRPYQHMMHKIPEGIEFLFSDRLSSSVDATAKQLAAIYGLVKEKVIEEFRRLMAIKTFTAR
ncbi:uncharacterized protein RSE6_05919 [Rhynchosporium secalis]|uniref:Uncharacterized protein n=1 Tax=Rhynchosporium secalis TaxID=38038 RepID=A0A1E1M956_RHYSE|nr:uncharacterized protein RSE6_05919 [Rhynchosporium secalis]